MPPTKEVLQKNVFQHLFGQPQVACTPHIETEIHISHRFVHSPPQRFGMFNGQLIRNDDFVGQAGQFHLKCSQEQRVLQFLQGSTQQIPLGHQGKGKGRTGTAFLTQQSRLLAKAELFGTNGSIDFQGIIEIRNCLIFQTPLVKPISVLLHFCTGRKQNVAHEFPIETRVSLKYEAQKVHDETFILRIKAFPKILILQRMGRKRVPGFQQVYVFRSCSHGYPSFEEGHEQLEIRMIDPGQESFLTGSSQALQPGDRLSRVESVFLPPFQVKEVIHLLDGGQSQHRRGIVRPDLLDGEVEILGGQSSHNGFGIGTGQDDFHPFLGRQTHQMRAELPGRNPLKSFFIQFQ